MKSNIEYLVVTGERLYDLHTLVRERIQEGWIPIGGVACSNSHTPHGGSEIEIWAQAMTKNAQED